MQVFCGVQEHSHNPIRTPKCVLCQGNVKNRIENDSKFTKNTKYSYKNTKKHPHIEKYANFT